MIVSSQGTKLSVGQREQLAFRERCKAAFLNPVLQKSVDETIKLIDQRKEQGIKPERVWTIEYEQHGTSSVAEWMGY